MLRKIKDTISIFIKTNRRLFLSCVWLVSFLLFAYFSLESPKAVLNDCTATSALNTTYPPNICNPIACSSSALSASTAKNPDNAAGYNCYYAPLGVPLRPCKAFRSAAAVSPKNPRENCADLIDLPLCSILPPASVSAGVNCVMEAKNVTDPNSAASPRKERGVDYGLNNKDSIRFCGQVEPCNTAVGEVCNATQMNSASNCTLLPKCHQLTAAQTPNNGTNCNVLKCSLLALDEFKVADSRFDNELKQYCDGSTDKCYNFFNNTASNPTNSSNLQYLRYRLNNTVCQIHTCRPDSALCGVGDSGINDVSNILGKDSVYQANYIQYINGGMPVESGLCQPLACKPIAFRQYRCLPMEETDPTTLNSDCDNCVKCAPSEACPVVSGCEAGKKPQVCSGGYCNKIIDCNSTNSPDNSHEPECVVSTPDSPDASSDLFNAWFFRPTPPSRVTNEDTGLIKSSIADKIKDDLCYSYNEVKDLNWLHDHTVGICSISCDHYYWHYLWDDTRSPNLCSGRREGFRGNGYGYLCGTNSNIFNNPNDSVGYIRGLARVNYELEEPEYKIKACLRYTNSGQTKVCGERECRFSISKGPRSSEVQSQWCGYDKCKEMTISQSDVDRCSMKKHSGLFDTDSSPDCVSSTIDGYVRMRARKYGRMLCVFVDQKGAVAYKSKNFDGKEKLSDGTCIDGDPNSDGNCNGKDTNDAKGSATVWRTVKMIKYIGNNRPGNQKSGYIDAGGRFFAEQDCAKIPLRIGPPRLYGVATLVTAKNLFEPPLYILNARTERGGQISDPLPGEQFGFTDFYKPEIVVGYGFMQQKMSLGAGFIGNDAVQENYPSSPWSKIIENRVGETPYSADIFIKKEYNEELSQPTLCLYRRVNDATGMPTDPIRIKCVKRTKPEISDIFGNRARMKVSIIPDPNNIFNNAKLKLRLLIDYGANNQNNNCTADDTCSVCEASGDCVDNAFIFQNITTTADRCTKDIEEYKICSSRDTCSRLLYECADNEIALHNAQVTGAATAGFDAVKTECNTTLLTECNRKLGIVNSAAADFFSQLDNSTATADNIDRNYQNFPSILNAAARAAIDPRYAKAYGWFNEMCIVKGFEDKLKKIIAYKTVDGILGKCQVDVGKSIYLNDGDSRTNCDAGGKAPYCVCIRAPSSEVILDADQEIRLETPREAGLCIDIPIPRFCQAIDYTLVNSSNPNDLDFARSSVTNSVTNNIFGPNYSDANGVHTSHKLRQENITLNPSVFDAGGAAVNANYAEYSSILGGINTVDGVCNGFWKPQTNSSGANLQPILNCGIDGRWQKPTISNSCTRYSCPAVTTFGIQDGNPSDNSYQNDYAIGETGDARGSKHGFAVWPTKQKSNDFLENVTTNSCIVGYALPRDASNNLLTPTRACNQLGGWEAVINPCSRIKCSAITVANGALPSARNTPAEITAWNTYGGAEFAQGKASRSDTFVPSESTVTGTCKSSVGFFPGVNPPTMDCNSSGSWTNLQNPCARLDCSQVANTESLTSNNGFANWPLSNISTTNQPIIITAPTCATGYFQNPYTSMPTRECQPVFADSRWVSQWGAVTNPCINKCPGADMDATIGVGTTTELTANGTVNIAWQSIAPVSGAITANSYAYTPDNCSSMNAGTFTQGRGNGCYRLRRLCGNGTNGFAKGQWGPVEPMCVANNGQNGNAKFDLGPTTSGSADSVAVNGVTVTATECISGYGAKFPTPLPQRKCVYDDINNNGTIETSEKIIDKVYLKLVAPTQDCEQLCSMAAGVNIGNSTNSTPITKFPGEALDLDCKSGFGHKMGSGGDSSCGRNASDRSSTSPSVTCNANGTWSTIINDCVACRSCAENDTTSTGGNVISNTTVSTSYGCNDYSVSASDLVNECRNNNVNYSTSHNGTIKLGHTKKRSCRRETSPGAWGSCNNERYICGAVQLKCIDGYLKYTDDLSHTNGGDSTCNNGVTQCGDSSQSCGKL